MTTQRKSSGKTAGEFGFAADNIAGQRPDGSWGPVEPLKGSRFCRVESWCRKHHLGRVASLLAWYDELWLR